MVKLTTSDATSRLGTIDRIGVQTRYGNTRTLWKIRTLRFDLIDRCWATRCSGTTSSRTEVAGQATPTRRGRITIVRVLWQGSGDHWWDRIGMPRKGIWSSFFRHH